MYTVTSTFTAGSKAPVARVWDSLDKVQVVDRIEAALITALQRLNHAASDVEHKRAAAPTANTNPANVKYTLVITKDGAPWSNTTLEWFGLGDEMQAAMLGVINGQLSQIGSSTAAKEKKAAGKKP